MSKRKNPFAEKTILKIPKSDFPSLGHTAIHNNGISSSQQGPSPLLLLQLPTNLTVDDLTKSHFAFDHDDLNQCRLISEDKGITFDLVKVSSSNSYVLVPDDEKGEKTTSNHHRNQETPMSDVNGSGSDKYVQARLLRETDTFIIECMERKIDFQAEIRNILQEFVYPTKGISIDQISARLMCSKKEVKIALDKMKAFQVSCGKSQQPTTYGVLSEEMEREVWFVIRSVLSEWDGGSDYAGKGVLLEHMIEEILQRNDGSEGDYLEEGVVRCCLNKCIVDIDNNGLVRLDADYIARIIAHHVFNLQKDPWEKEMFVKQWHKLMPGVGPLYEPKLTILGGIAIETSNVSPLVANANEPLAMSEKNKRENRTTYLKYFPRDCLPSSLDGRFKALFKEKSKWKLDELMPYIEDLLEKSNFKTVQELLLAFTKIAPKENELEEGRDDEDIDWYIAK